MALNVNIYTMSFEENLKAHLTFNKYFWRIYQILGYEYKKIQHSVERGKIEN